MFVGAPGAERGWRSEDEPFEGLEQRVVSPFARHASPDGIYAEE